MSVQDRIANDAKQLAEQALSSNDPQVVNGVLRQLTSSIQNGAIQPYVGVPFVQPISQHLAQLQQAQQMQQAQATTDTLPEQGIPQVAPQIIAQAKGLEGVKSNLPVGDNVYAAGGIIAFAGGDLVDDDETDDDREESSLLSLMDAARNKIQAGLGSATSGIMSQLPKSYDATLAAQKSGGQSEGSEGFLSKIEHLESRGRHFDTKGNILTSPKGAEGIMQVMRHTQRDPGFGVTPAKDKSPEELRRVGRDYGLAMLNEFGGDTKLAAMAYNWGPGNVKKWIASGYKLPVPKETREYAANFAKGGEVKHFDGTDGSYVGFGEELPYDPSSSWGIADWWKRHTFGTKENIEAATPKAKPVNVSRADLGTTQEMEDQESNKPAVIPVAPKAAPEEAPKVITPAGPQGGAQPSAEETDPYLAKYMSMLQKREADSEKQKEIDAYMALMQAGLGMMASRSPYALGGIGEGGMQGIASYMAADKARSAADAATLAGYGKLYTAKQAADLRRELAAEGKEVKLGQLAQNRELQLGKQISYLENAINNVAEKNIKTALGTGFNDLSPEDKLSMIEKEARRLKSQNKQLAKLYKEVGMPELDLSGPDMAPPTTEQYVKMFGIKPKQ